MNGGGHDILVSNTDICTLMAIFVNGVNGSSIGRRHGCYNDGSKFPTSYIRIRWNYMKRVEFYAGLRSTIAIGSLMHHIDFLFVANSRHVPVVANANQQTSSISISERRYRLGKLHSILYSVFEVLLLMLTLINKALNISFVVHFIIFSSSF